jgi:glycosyltransferase involved in cell wall biosynthesis
MKIAYLTPFYSGECEGRFGRFNDCIHALRDMDDPPFDFEVHAFAAAAPDGTLASPPHELLGDGDELWATKRNNLEHLLNVPRLLRDLRRSDADLLHPVTVGPVVSPVARAGATGRPVVLGPNVGGWYPLREGPNWATAGLGRPKQAAKFRLRRRFVDLTAPARHLAFSRYHLSMLEQLGVDPGQVEVLEAGVDSRFSPADGPREPADPPELLYVGVFSKHKGVHVLLNAVERLDREVRLRLVGGTAVDLSRPLPDGVTAEGFVPRADLPSWYRRADLFVCPSIDETAGPNTQIEALACGTPVVATDEPSMNEYAPPDAAALFRPREPKPLAAAIAVALDSLPEMRAAALDHADSFHAERVVDQLDGLYRGLRDTVA